MTKQIIYGVFALALLTTTLGCPPPAPPSDVDIDISLGEVETKPAKGPSDNMTGMDNTTAITEVPSDNLTSGGETP